VNPRYGKVSVPLLNSVRHEPNFFFRSRRICVRADRRCEEKAAYMQRPIHGRSACQARRTQRNGRTESLQRVWLPALLASQRSLLNKTDSPLKMSYLFRKSTVWAVFNNWLEMIFFHKVTESSWNGVTICSEQRRSFSLPVD
jgi:hypothetical protein